jgi:hypothetical protein
MYWHRNKHTTAGDVEACLTAKKEWHCLVLFYLML